MYNTSVMSHLIAGRSVHYLFRNRYNFFFLQLTLHFFLFSVAARLNIQHATDDEVETEVMRLLKRAKDRHGGRDRRRQAKAAKRRMMDLSDAS
jgi:hypothetical protein